MKKRILSVLAALICMLGLASCGQSIAKEAEEKGRSYFDSGEYETAAKAFGVAIDNGSENEETKLLYGICLSYYQAGREYEAGNLETAKKALDGIDAGYTKYGISETVDSLRSNVEKKLDVKAKLDDAAYRVSVADFSGAASVIAKVDTAILTEAELATVNSLNTAIAEAEAAARAAEEAQKKAAEEAKRKAEAAAKAAEEAKKAESQQPVASAPAINMNVANDAYIFPTDSQLLTWEQLQTLSSADISLIRNEIYARHGQIFTSAKYASYFSQKTWYTASNADVRWGELNDTERKNITLIKQYQNGR